MSNNIKLDQFYWHEALDRTHVILSNIDDHLIQHPVLKLNPDIRRLIEKASENLSEAYQLLGDKHLDDEPNKQIQ